MVEKIIKLTDEYRKLAKNIIKNPEKYKHYGSFRGGTYESKLHMFLKIVVGKEFEKKGYDIYIESGISSECTFDVLAEKRDLSEKIGIECETLCIPKKLKFFKQRGNCGATKIIIAYPDYYMIREDFGFDILKVEIPAFLPVPKISKTFTIDTRLWSNFVKITKNRDIGKEIDKMMNFYVINYDSLLLKFKQALDKDLKF
ncbi:MAG: hypothetical protein GTN82_43095 [Candidatus Aminicenantes bacterium]|nr:hypothetical protein [Candidatus Aminicenantes bacterium]